MLRMAGQTTVARPFHEAIVDAIRGASSRELECLGSVIKMTEVPKNHDEIIAAWNERRGQMCWGDEDLGVPAYLLEQKAVAMNNPNDERPITFSLAELEKEAEVLVSFIRDRHYPGLPAWRYTLRDHMRNLRRLISEDLGE